MYSKKFFFPVVFFFACLLLSCDKQPSTMSGKTMGSSYHITIVDRLDDETVRQIDKDIAAILDDAHAKMTTYDSSSELNTFNRAPVDEWVTLSPLLYKAIEVSLDIASLSEGAFDITVFPLIKLWGFGPDKNSQSIPDADVIDQILPRVNYRNIVLDTKSQRIKKASPLEIDLSGMGHGYGADLVAEYLNGKNIQHYLVEVAGEIRTKGKRKDGTQWRIAIEKPNDIQGEVFIGLNVDDIGLATSGDYRNYYMHNGMRYSHTIDPKTGRPVMHQLASVTVLDPSAARADSLATALLVMGTEHGKTFAEKFNIPAYFIERNGSGFKGISTYSFRPYMIEDSHY